MSLENDSVFGHLNSKNFFFNTFYFGFVCGIGGTIGAVIVLQSGYFPTILIMNLCLLRPIISQAAGIYLKIDEYPGVMTYAGGILVLGSIYVIN